MGNHFFPVSNNSRARCKATSLFFLSSSLSRFDTTGREETKRRQRQTHGWLALDSRTVVHHSERYHTFAFLMLMCCLFVVMSTCNWILIHYTFNEPLVREVKGGERGRGGGSHRWCRQFLTTRVENASLVCVEVYFVRAKTTPLRQKQFCFLGFVPVVPELPSPPLTERTSHLPTLSHRLPWAPARAKEQRSLWLCLVFCSRSCTANSIHSVMDRWARNRSKKSTSCEIVLMVEALLMIRLEILKIIRWDWDGGQMRRGGPDLRDLLRHCKLTCYVKIHSEFSWFSVQGNNTLQFRRIWKIKQWPTLCITKTKQRDGKVLNGQDKLLENPSILYLPFSF